jgi:hypothetical protein
MSARAGRLAAVVALGLGLCLVPIRQVTACDCAVRELPEAIAEAEVAIIGTLAGAGGAAAVPGMAAEPTEYVWSIERARDPMSAVTLSVAAWPDDGANCGISFAADERWLILASQSEGRLETNGCMSNIRLDEAPPEIVGMVESQVAVPVDPRASEAERGGPPPLPILVALGALVVMTAVSVLAFRRAGSGTAAQV